MGRRQAETGGHGRFVVQYAVGQTAAHRVNGRITIHELQGVEVAGYDDFFNAVIGSGRDRADQIIGFIAGFFIYRDAQSRGQFFDQRYLAV